MKINKLDCFVAAAVLLITGLTADPSSAQQNLVRFISPASTLTVRPGQTVAITLSADTAVQKLVLTGQQPLGMARLVSDGAAGIVAHGQGEEHPLQFLLTIPTAIQPGSYHVTAVGKTSTGIVVSKALDLDVERPDDPARITIEPSIIEFTHIGDQIPVRVLGVFANTSHVDLTHSSKTMFASSDPRVASITSNGMVTALAEGRASIVVRTPSADYSIPVQVQEAR